MSDDPPPSRPPLVRPTAAWLAEQRAKRLAYEEGRRHHAQAWHRSGEPEEEPEAPTAEGTASGRGRRSSRGTIHDKRQGRFEV